MPLLSAGYLLDFLAPRIFRHSVPCRARGSVGRGARSGSSAAAVAPQIIEGESSDRGIETRVQTEGEAAAAGDGPVAGPSRWYGQLRDEPPHLLPMSREERVARSQSDGGQGVAAELAVSALRGRSRIEDQNNIPHSQSHSQSTLPSPHQPLYTPPPRLGFRKNRKRMSQLRAAELISPTPFTSHFIQPNPPPASALFPILQTSNLTRASGDLLIRYSQRVDDQRTEAATRDLLGRMRIAPVSWISTPDPERRRTDLDLDLARGRIMGEVIQGEQGFGSGDDPPELHNGELSAPTGPVQILVPRKPTSPEMRELRDKSNMWAKGMWPPTSPTSYTPSKPLDPHTFLCRFHYLLLNPPRGVRPVFIDAVRNLEMLPGVKDRDSISLLHLELAYPTYSHSAPPSTTTPSPVPSLPLAASSLLTPLFQLLLHCPHLTPTRQTLHLLILSTLCTPFKLLFAGTPPPTGGRRAEIQSLLTVFRTQWRISPGCEGWRHITRYAVYHNEERWAREGWEGWWRVRNRYEVLYPGDGDVREDQEVEAEEMEEVDEGEEDEEDIVFRFRHRGREFFRMMRTVKKMEEKGWVRQREIYGDRRQIGKDGWDWVGKAKKG